MTPEPGGPADPPDPADPADPADLDGAPDFARRIQPRLEAIAYFRRATDEELSASFAAYRDGGAAALIDCWLRVAEPTRAKLDGFGGLMYRRARLLPRRFNRMTFLATIRAVLAAGRNFFDRQLRPESARAIRGAFSFLERRHEHIPPGYTPELSFPEAFVQFVDGGTVAQAKARFYLIAAINEVQQHAYSLHLADRLALPELRRHAALERAMAIQYFAAWSPRVSEALWRQSIAALDGLNAAVFEMALQTRRLSFPAEAMWHALSADAEWRRFVDGLDAAEARR